MTLRDLLTTDAFSDFYNKKPTGDEKIDEMNRWFYVDGKKKIFIEKIDENVLKGGNLDKISNGWGQTLLTAAIINSKHDFAKKLLKCGARADAPNFLYIEGKKGQLPLELAKQKARFNKEDVALVKLLEKFLCSYTASKRDVAHQF